MRRERNHGARGRNCKEEDGDSLCVLVLTRYNNKHKGVENKQKSRGPDVPTFRYRERGGKKARGKEKMVLSQTEYNGLLATSL